MHNKYLYSYLKRLSPKARLLIVMLLCLAIAYAFMSYSSYRKTTSQFLFPVYIENRWGLPGRYGYIDETGQIVITLSAWVFYAGPFQGDHAIIQSGIPFFFSSKMIDTRGRYVTRYPVCPRVLSDTGLTLANRRTNRFIPEFLDERLPYGFINSTGTWAIEPKYIDARGFSEGLAWVVPYGTHSGGYIDVLGNWEILPAYYTGGNFSEGMALVSGFGIQGFIDRDANFVLVPESVKYVHPFSEGLCAAVTKNDVTGFLNKQGEWEISPRFPSIGSFPPQVFSDGVFPVSDGLGHGYIDRSGEWVISPDYTFTKSFSEGLAAVRKEDKYGYIDITGEVIIPFQFENADNFRHGLAHVDYDTCPEMGSLYNGRYIDRAGNVIWPQK